MNSLFVVIISAALLVAYSLLSEEHQEALFVDPPHLHLLLAFTCFVSIIYTLFERAGFFEEIETTEQRRIKLLEEVQGVNCLKRTIVDSDNSCTKRK